MSEEPPTNGQESPGPKPLRQRQQLASVLLQALEHELATREAEGFPALWNEIMGALEQLRIEIQCRYLNQAQQAARKAESDAALHRIMRKDIDRRG